MWDYTKDKPSTLEYLETNIRQVMAEIPPNMYQKAIENYLKRVNDCNTSHEGHLDEEIEKIFCMCFIYVYF